MNTNRRSAQFLAIVFSALLVMSAAGTGALSGVGFANAQQAGTNDIEVGFESDTLDVNINRPTDVQFGPDGRLYVAQQKGVIKAFEVERQGPEDYVATSSETITAINDLQNHNDDGSTDGVPDDRQVTGMLVTGTADDVVIYVTSSDPRSRSSPVSDRSDALDTNSGILSKLTQDGSSWNHLALVRGLPRSTEKHSTNDLIMDEDTGKLLISQGGNSGAGAPNDEFTFTPEYAYSAAILSVDVGALESKSTKTDYGNVPYKYDLPTLNASVSNAPDDTPFGGMGGQNMAIWKSGSPVQVYASGLRNSYDITQTQNGTLYATDNGVGGGWGAPPVNEGTSNCLNQPVSDGNPEDPDQLHLIQKDAYYGHPNPTRGNPDGAGLYEAQSGGAQIGSDDILANAVPSANPIECDYQQPGSEDGAVETFGMSTNGVHEYSASNFGGKMQGDLLAAGLNGPVFRVQLNSDGTAATETTQLFTTGTGPLDIEAQGDNDQFPGTVWVADIYGSSINIYEPNDYDGSTTCDPSDPDGDADGDGFTNGDEQAVGTDPCSSASQPGDWDDDGNPNALDSDDDNDGIPDTEDPFAIDPDNGATTQVVTDCPADPEGAAETCLTFNSNQGFENTLFGLGFTGVMTNGQDDYADLFDRSKIQAGGAADIFGIEEVTGDGSAYGTDDDQRQGFQFGAAPPNEPFVVHGEITNGFSGEVPPEYWNYGIFLGDGTQANYTKLVIGSDGGSGGEIEYVVEEENNPSGTQVPEDGVIGNTVDLYITVDPTTDPVSVTYEYAIDGGDRIEAGTATIPSSWVSGDSMAIGLLPTATGASGSYSANYNELEVELVKESVDPEASVAITPNSGVDASTWSNDAYQIENTGEVNITSVSIDTNTSILPDLVFDPYGTAGDGGDKSFQVGTNDGVGLGSTADADIFSQPKNDAGGDDGFEQMTLTFDHFESGESLTFGSDGDPTSIKGAGSAQQDAAGPVSGAELAGTTITVEFANGETKTVRTFGDGSAGGSTAVSSADQSTAPTLGLQNGALDDSALDARHSAATVTDTAQTLTVSGQAGETVTVMQADSELNLEDVPTYDGTPGYNVEPYEGNNFLSVTYHEVTLGSDGTAMVDVTVPDADSQQAYFMAASQNGDGTMSAPSNVVVLEHEADDTGGDTPTDGEAVYRVNAGGSQLSATDSGPAWESDTNNDPSQYRSSADSDNSDMSGPDGDTVTVQDVVPDSTPADLYQSTRYDPATGSEMQWGFPVQSGETYEVRVYVAETYLTDDSGSNPNSQDGPREYDVTIEDQTVLDDYNMYQELGHDVGSVKTFEVTPSDDTLNVEFLHELENPMIAGLEVVKLSDGNTAPTIDPIANQTVTEGDSTTVAVNASDDNGDSVSLSLGQAPDFVSLSNGEIAIAPQSGDATNSPYTVEVVADDGTDQTTESFQVTVEEATASASVSINPDGGVDATTWSNDAYQIENTGNVEITSVSFNTNTTILPDLVYDPYGTAGDGGDKSFQAGSGSDDVGVVSTADADLFDKPKNDAGGDDGFQRLTLEFDDFQPGETLAFGSDGDPTSIKGAANNVQNDLAGPVSGAELAGVTVTVEFADGTTKTVRTFGDGSAGGSAVVSSADQSAQAPTLGVQDVSLDDGALDQRHSASYVAGADQTLTVSGSAGATVQVMQANTELNLEGVPEYDGTPGYNIEEFEGNNFLSVSYQTVQLGSDGQATVNVTLPDDPEQPVYFMAAMQNADDSMGAPSNVVVLQNDPSQVDTGLEPIGDFENAPTDPDDDGVYEDVNGDGSVDVLDAQAIFANTQDSVIQNNVEAFDFNDDGSVDVLDAQALFANGVGV